MFADLKDAKREPRLAAEKIMQGMQSQNDLRPADRESFLAAQRILQEINMPIVAASEDYVQCRKLLGDAPLRQAVEDFCRRTNGVKLGVTVPEIATEVIATKLPGTSGSKLLLNQRRRWPPCRRPTVTRCPPPPTPGRWRGGRWRVEKANSFSR